MPGLIRGVARTAAIAGTATAVSNGVSRRQAQKWSQQGPPVQAPYAVQVSPGPAPTPQYAQQAPPQYSQPAPVAAPAPLTAIAPEEDVMTRIEKLAKLHGAGLITDDEFAEQKQRILAEL